MATTIDISFDMTYSEMIAYNDFPFDKNEGIIKITPLNKALPSNVLRAFKRDIAGNMLSFRCYTNAVVAALYLQNFGLDVDVVEGWYRLNLDSVSKDFYNTFSLESKWSTHRWLKINGKYVDVTIECDESKYLPRHFDYKSARLYDAEDLLAFALKAGHDHYGTQEPLWCSTLDGINFRDGVPFKWSLVDESGNYVCLNNTVKTAA